MSSHPHTVVSRATFLAAAAGLVLAACGSSDDSAAEPVAPGGGALESVVPAALIGATTIDGEPFDAAALAGRPTVAWFWAPWCVVCRAEAPDVAEAATRYAGVVNVVGVAGLSELSEMRDFVSDTGTEGITHINDASGEIWASYEVYSQPAFAFITDDGRLELYVGSLGTDGLADIIEKLIVA